MGRHEKAMEAAKQNMDAYAKLRASQGQPATPRR